jgi:HSP20 family protein
MVRTQASNVITDFAEMARVAARLVRDFDAEIRLALEHEGDAGGARKCDVDAEETQDAYVFTADIPGVKPDDAIVELDGELRRMTLRGRHGFETKGPFMWPKERREEGEFSRSFALPADADVYNAIEARCVDGVLRVTVKKIVVSALGVTVRRVA